MWHINAQEYFEAPGLSALVFHNTYIPGKQGGFELIQHDERVITNGCISLSSTPEQWMPTPEIGQRQVDVAAGKMSIPLQYADDDLEYTLHLCAEGQTLRLRVDLAHPLPQQSVGHVGFNLEIFPEAYFGKTFHLGETPGVFLRQPNGPMLPADQDGWQPAPLATGVRLVIAPEDPLRKIGFEAVNGTFSLYDGRVRAQNGWFVLRGLLAADTTVGALEWLITPHSVPGWRRAPVLCMSQVGYHPAQAKQVVLELDPQTETLESAQLERIEPQGETRVVLSAMPRRWGRFWRYEYAIFDFSAVREPGLYRVRYGEQLTLPFRIGPDVYQRDVWQPTLETFLPVQMCHMQVRDRYQVWHGACHLDDALQAPPDHEHFDEYRQGPQIGTSYAPLTHIPGLERGGWHDAGDYDLATGAQATTTHMLVLIREAFGVDSDQTTVQRDRRKVILHQPDGVPDILEQIIHGVDFLLGSYRAVGHSITGIIESTFEQYVHLGDAATNTDNRIYDPALQADEVAGERAGKRDDRWVFTGRNSVLEYQAVAALAAASRVLRDHDAALAEECLQTAVRVWEYEQSHAPVEMRNVYVFDKAVQQEIGATTELFLATGDAPYRQRLLELWPEIEFYLRYNGWTVVRALPMLNDAAFTANFRAALEKYRVETDAELARNPFGVPLQPQVWGMAWNIQWFGVIRYYLCRAFPDLFDREDVLRVLSYTLGCHPASDVSLVSGVGARSMLSGYGTNRAEWSYIPGGVASGPTLIRPDFPEFKQPFPFLWQQAEYAIVGATTYLFCALAADRLLNDEAGDLD
jgi:hypothetical protein